MYELETYIVGLRPIRLMRQMTGFFLKNIMGLLVSMDSSFLLSFWRDRLLETPQARPEGTGSIINTFKRADD